MKNTLLHHNQVYINGRWQAAENQETFAVYNPGDASLLGEAANCGQTETRAAIEAAHQALQGWRSLTAKARADILNKWYELIQEHREVLANLMVLEQGKPLSEALGEVDYANAFIHWFAEEGKRVYGDIIPANKPEQRLFVIKQAVGVVAAITPWNFPLAMITRKCAPALAAGCTVVIKPAEETPYSALALADLAEQAGMPPGVLNVVTGQPEAIGKELCANPLVKKLSFTGSTQVGKLLMSACADSIKKLSLELGGNAPFIIFEDADFEAAIKGVLASKFRNTGQTCVCANRIFVHDAIYAEFSARLVAEVKKMKVGNGLEPDVHQGPLINAAGLDKVIAHVEDACNKGAKILCGGKRINRPGAYFEPTVLSDVNNTMRLATEETFGPVAPLFRFKQEDEVIREANNTHAGLASYIYTRDIAKMWRVAEALEYGMVGVNEGIISTEVAPFGGVKESGIGREGSKYGIEDYLDLKYICLSLI